MTALPHHVWDLPPTEDFDRLLSVRDVRTWLGVSDRWIRRNMAAARFPRPDFRLGKSLRWRRSTIAAWLQEHQT